jgi:hypothetical protein
MNAVAVARRYNAHREARSFISSITSCRICSAAGVSRSTVGEMSTRYFPQRGCLFGPFRGICTRKYSIKKDAYCHFYS